MYLSFAPLKPLTHKGKQDLPMVGDNSQFEAPQQLRGSNWILLGGARLGRLACTQGLTTSYVRRPSIAKTGLGKSVSITNV